MTDNAVWQKKIKMKEKQQIKCPHKKGILCTLIIPSVACLNCENYISSVNGPGAV